MINTIWSALQYGFMQNALITAVLISIACGIIGTYVVLKRIVFLSGGVAHAAYGGIGLGYLLKIPPLVSALGFSLLASFSMAWVHRKTKERSDTIIGVMWALGMALGIIFVDLASGYKADLMSYLFGSILAVSQLELMLMAVMDILIIVLAALFFKEFLALSFDETFTTIRNVAVDWLYVILVGMIGLTVVMMMRVVGLIMVIALLTIPPAISNMFVKEMKKMMVMSILLSLVFTTSGLLVSYLIDLTSGAVIIMISGIAYLLSYVGKNLYQIFKNRQAGVEVHE
ncbi:MAG TPA: metal ABC transporter permease [Chloroflexi bacterium]|nr:metal ABC transporter permease [Chloroflexota bacterium]